MTCSWCHLGAKTVKMVAVRMEVTAGVLFLAIFAALTDLINAQDILGCGGFVKSEVEINFSMVEVSIS